MQQVTTDVSLVFFSLVFGKVIMVLVFSLDIVCFIPSGSSLCIMFCFTLPVLFFFFNHLFPVHLCFISELVLVYVCSFTGCQVVSFVPGIAVSASCVYCTSASVCWASSWFVLHVLLYFSSLFWIFSSLLLPFFPGIQLSRLKLLFSYIHPSVLTSESFLQKHNSISVLFACPHKCSRQPADTFQDKARTSAFYFLADCKKKTDFVFQRSR